MQTLEKRTSTKLILLVASRLASFSLVAALWTTGCLGGTSLEKEAQQKYRRSGEKKIVQYSESVVSNAIVSWATTLTNGYKLYDNPTARRNPAFFKNDPAIIFLLDNDTNGITPWGPSSCLPGSNSLYWGRIIIWVRPAVEGHEVSVAIHGRYHVAGAAWNFHTFGIDRQKAVDLPACPEDERNILNQLDAIMSRSPIGQTPTPRPGRQ